MSDVSSIAGDDDDDIVKLHENTQDGVGAQDDQMSQAVGQDADGEVKDGDASGNEQNDDENKAVVPPKKRITRKLFVLNVDRLKGPKGVHSIEKLYEGFKFQGKGHEKEDLDKIMKRLEYWAFRCYPKLDFDDFLTKCESLGHKKELQTFLKRYRLGMISADDINQQNDVIQDDDDDLRDDPAIRNTESGLLAEISNDEFQRLFDENVQAMEQVS